MTSFKNIEARHSKSKYGETHRGIFSNEKILSGELIRHCECGSNDGKYTRDMLLEIIRETPKLEYFVRSFSYMVDDDVYQLASKYREETVNDMCSYFNHSCEPNCGFDLTGHGYCALKNIEINDEVVYHYGLLETESSLINGLECKCGATSCEGKLSFGNYRDEDFVAKYLDYFTPYLRRKVRDLKERWYSSSCYVKRIPSRETENIEEWKVGLFSYKEIKNDELVAKYTSNEHFLRHSEKPNCYIKDNNVFASEDIKVESELTV